MLLRALHVHRLDPRSQVLNLGRESPIGCLCVACLLLRVVARSGELVDARLRTFTLILTLILGGTVVLPGDGIWHLEQTFRDSDFRGELV